jgi:hypothetical protein
MTIQILSELDRLMPPEIGAVDPLVKTLRNSPAKLEMMRDAKKSGASRLAARGGVVIAFLRELRATSAEEEGKLKNISPGTHSPIELDGA